MKLCPATDGLFCIERRLVRRLELAARCSFLNYHTLSASQIQALIPNVELDSAPNAPNTPKFAWVWRCRSLLLLLCTPSSPSSSPSSYSSSSIDRCLRCSPGRIVFAVVLCYCHRRVCWWHRSRCVGGGFEAVDVLDEDGDAECAEIFFGESVGCKIRR